ncbi:unnamed protein product [Bursaphelenchus okinawaensis]|uniref:Uncharacterized protein n=1 Tax=Bursaphelenchus okinawaensis TaxID=465554 RepID=A0A811L9E6_9BILA|nr:unnamed protein product [Bursaphelenchus okinawaensis]CAG9121490.1 unnamed protein product [Bursaphelenchus okinawaensis]
MSWFSFITLNYITFVCFVLIQVFALLVCSKPKPVDSAKVKRKHVQPQRKRVVVRREVLSPDSEEREVQLEYYGSQKSDDYRYPSSLENSTQLDNHHQLKTCEGEPSTQESADTATLPTSKELEKPKKGGGFNWFKKTTNKKHTTMKTQTEEPVITGLENSHKEQKEQHRVQPMAKKKRVRPLKEAHRPKSPTPPAETQKTKTHDVFVDCP